jgi:hypothetical protein
MHTLATESRTRTAAAAARTGIPAFILDQAVDIHSAFNGRQLGSGLVINREWILSARHCYANEPDGSCTPNTSGFRKGASRPGKWWRGWRYRDLAILRLDQQISATPIPIEKIEPSLDMPGFIVGYGKLAGQLDVRPVKVCRVKPKRVKVEVTDEKDLLCYGDSGGALFLDGGDGSYVFAGVMIENAGRLLKLLFERVVAFFGYPAADCFSRAWCRRVYPYKKSIENGMRGERMPCDRYLLHWLVRRLLQSRRQASSTS